MTFPMIVADYFAKACGLPNLFVGTYGDTTIEYINVIRSEDAFGWGSRTTVLVKSDKWLRACEYSLGKFRGQGAKTARLSVFYVTNC